MAAPHCARQKPVRKEQMIVLTGEKNTVVEEGKERIGRHCHRSKEGGSFCSAWQVELSDAAGRLAHMPRLLPQAQL